MTRDLKPGYIWCRKCLAPVKIGKQCPICHTHSIPQPRETGT